MWEPRLPSPMTYYAERRVDADFEATVAAAEEALTDEGFGVLCDIPVHEKFAEKLDVTGFPNYRILGACNPALAHEGLQAEPALGALLPCNVVVYEDGDEVVVAAVDPGELLSVVDNEALDPIAAEVEERLERVLDAVAGT